MFPSRMNCKAAKSLKTFVVVAVVLPPTNCAFGFIPQTQSKSFAATQIPSTPIHPSLMASTNSEASSRLSLDDQLLDKVLEVAIDASKKAGDIIVGNAGGAEVTERKANSRDLLTLIDPLCEKVSYVPLGRLVIDASLRSRRCFLAF